MTPIKTTLAIWLSLGLLVQCDVSTGVKHETSGNEFTTIKILAFNDFHGQLESPGPFPLSPSASLANAIPVGGVDWMAGYIANFKAQNPNTIVVSAGDLIGATPLISALFHDEATIEAINRLGLDFIAVGNHEFDEGKAELLRMQTGGCHPTDQNSCRGADVGTPVPFEGAQFSYLAANVMDLETQNTLFPAFAIKTLAGIRIAFIGLTLKETPEIVKPKSVAELEFKDETETISALIPTLRKSQANAIVVLIHQGGVLPVDQSVATINSCDGNLERESPIKTIINQLDDAVDLVISGHTHQAYNCRIANRNGRLIPVTSANAQGRVLTDFDIRFNKASGKVFDISATNIVVDQTSQQITPDKRIRNLVDNYATIARPLVNRVIGRISTTISREPNTAGESALGDLLADAQLAAAKGNAVITFTNPGGIRADLTYLSSEANEGDGNVSYGEAFKVQPFGDSIVSMTLTGAQLHTLLEQQFTDCTMGYPDNVPKSGQPFNRILQVSQGFSYRWREKGTPCDNVDPADMRLNGAPIDLKKNYRIAVNQYLAEGGDKFYVLTQGSRRLGGPQDINVLVNYFNAQPLIKPGILNRITQLR